MGSLRGPLFTWAALRSSSQGSFYVGWDGKENEEKISSVEKTIYFQRWKNHPH